MNKYELVYIIDTVVEEEARKALVEKFNTLITENGGEIEKVEEWGKRRLAYAINYKTEGYYVLVNFSAASELPLELERNLKINESIIRYQTVRILERKVGIKPRAPRVMAAPVQAAEEVSEAANTDAE
ncbi:MAG: 30S ribosomal protein S6 [Clostridia bacterium]|nr:30S ribosomal protein S6 [Clostridia bacterium]